MDTFNDRKLSCTVSTAIELNSLEIWSVMTGSSRVDICSDPLRIWQEWGYNLLVEVEGTL